MRCKDMPKEPHYCQRIVCGVCHNPDGTMINQNGEYMHKNCNRPVNPAYLEQMRRAELQRAFDAGEVECQLCDEEPATAVIKNKYNGKKLLVCKGCLDYVTNLANRAEEEAIQRNADGTPYVAGECGVGGTP